VTAYAVDHASGAPALALRLVCDQRTLAYSGDTAWTPTLIEATAGADLFVCEAYTFDRPIRYHLDYATLAAHRAELGCRRLVLQHLGPAALAHQSEMDAEVATDGLSIRV
jgi:ribonuclease BN (tRNA processing enzyme)